MKLAILSSVALICIGQSFASPANNLARSSGSSSDNLRTANGSPYTPGESVPVIFSNAKRYKFDVVRFSALSCTTELLNNTQFS